MMGTSNEGCYICAGKNRYKTKESLQHEVDKKYPNTYIIIGEYVAARRPLLVRRIQCGHEYPVSPDNLLRGKGCPKCTIRQSSYMDMVEQYLDSHNITYVKEKRFDDCKNIRCLPFDYYIPDINACIEVDGQFHYPNDSTSKYLKGDSSYENVTKRDKIKTDYCIDHGIKLIRLPYYKSSEFSDILSKELHVNTEITN